MSSTNYDVELNITYDDAYKHYIPTYHVKVPWWQVWRNYHPEMHDVYFYSYYISFDDGNETEMGYTHDDLVCPPGTPPHWNDICTWNNWNVPLQGSNTLITESGIFSKAYIRNKRREEVTFTNLNCTIEPIYREKALFEVQWNTTGFAANQNAFFKCSTIQKNTHEQYEWISATVYYKESTDENYQSTSGVITGTWSDYTITTDLSLSDNVIYDIYIEATSDDNETAITPVAQFTTTDAQAVATCISPSGAFTSGEVVFVWSHSTAYGTPQYAYDLQYSNNNGSSWTTVANHAISQSTTDSVTLTDAGVYKWRVRTYNSNDVVGDWAEATFVNQVPANPPTNLQVTTKGRPTVSWASISQTAYQVQFWLADSLVYDSGAIYTSETNHFVNQYFNDTRSYIVKVRVYNALGEVSDWVETGYQQPSVEDVEFTVEPSEGGGAIITVIPKDNFIKYYVLRNNIPIAQIDRDAYTDIYSVGLTNYSVVGVTSGDQSDIQTKGIRIAYPRATLTAQNGQQFYINKRVAQAYQIETGNEAEVNKVKFIGDKIPTHYPGTMRLKSFTITMFDDQRIAESLLGTRVYYADNFENGGWCMVTAYGKTDNYVKNSQGIYANEVSLTLEVTNYDDSIEYSI